MYTHMYFFNLCCLSIGRRVVRDGVCRGSKVGDSLGVATIIRVEERESAAMEAPRLIH